MIGVQAMPAWEVRKRARPAARLPVWSYWDGPLPAANALCLDTLTRHEPQARVLDREGFRRLAGDRELPPAHLPVPYQADYIRLYLLARYGGVWVDADCIVIRPFDELLTALEGHDFVGYQVRPGGPLKNSVMASRPGGQVVCRARGVVARRLRGARPLRWGDTGEKALWRALRASQGCPVKRYPQWRFKMISDKGMGRYLQRGTDAQHAMNWNSNAFCYHLTHKAIGWLAGHTRAELLAGDLYVCFLFRRALGLGKEDIVTWT